MKPYKLIVLSNPTAGNDEEYNRWYSEQHLADVLNVQGFTAASRFSAAGPALENARWRYLAIYDFETDDVGKSIEALSEAAGGVRMPMSNAIDLGGLYMEAYEAIPGGKRP